MKNPDFVKRLVEICGTSQPQIACQLLEISYNNAKNYFRGRIPAVPVLIQISEKTDCSIHWLLTGKGEKFLSFDRNEDALRLSAEMRAVIRQECLELIKEVLRGNQQENLNEKVILLSSGNIREEKVKDEETVGFASSSE